MKYTQLIALLLVVMMAAAVMPAITAKEVQAAQASLVGAYRTPTLTIGHTPTNPARGQTYTVSGRLSWNGVGLANRPLVIWYMFPQSGTWQWHNYPYTVSTNAYGNYRFSTSSTPPLVWWKVRFAGDSVYYPKNAYNEVSIQQKLGTVLSITTISVSCSGSGVCSRAYGGYLKEARTGRPVVGVRVWVQRLDGSTWTSVGSALTDSTGHYKAWFACSYYVYYRAHFSGTSVYSPSDTEGWSSGACR